MLFAILFFVSNGAEISNAANVEKFLEINKYESLHCQMDWNHSATIKGDAVIYKVISTKSQRFEVYKASKENLRFVASCEDIVRI